MNNTIKIQYSSLIALDCPICSELLLDPRVLPCGHSFCGPPRTCLNGIKSLQPEKLKCAICNQTFVLKVDNLKPLYGIRDVLKDLDEASKYCGYNASSIYNIIAGLPNCIEHDNKVILWCEDCSSELCSVCFEEKHTDHPVQNVKNVVLKKRAGQMIDRIYKAKIYIDVYLEPSLKTCQKQTPKLGREAQVNTDLHAQLRDEKKTLEQLMKIENEFRKFCRGQRVHDIVSQLKRWESDLVVKVMEESEPEMFTLIIWNIRTVKKGIKSSTHVQYSGFLLSVEARFKPRALKQPPALELYLRVAKQPKNVACGKWQLALQLSLTMENSDTNKNISWKTSYSFNEKQSRRGCHFIDWDKLFSPPRGYLNRNEDLTLCLKLVKMH